MLLFIFISYLGTMLRHFNDSEGAHLIIVWFLRLGVLLLGGNVYRIIGGAKDGRCTGEVI